MLVRLTTSSSGSYSPRNVADDTGSPRGLRVTAEQLPRAVSLRVQVVLFRNDLGQLWRLTAGVAAAQQRAKAVGTLAQIELAFGDASPIPLLAPPGLEQLRDHACTRGIDAFSYQCFNENLGSAGGSNRLAADATTDHLLVLNPDTYPSPDLLVELLRAVRDPRVGIAEARQIPLEHPKAFDTHTGDTSWASGCCMLIPRPVFEAVGGFDPAHFFLHCDDVDFSWRVRLAGYRVMHVPSAAVFHDKRIDAGGGMVTPVVETYFGTLGRCMLARRYGREDVVAETLVWSERHGTKAHQDAAQEYRRRQAAGTLPPPLAGAARVAEFTGNNYAVHRF